jgi:signal transduction histidine kinase/ligand-binding sensor domain-containing protein/DNA-binding response OmpR family regulator
MKSFPYLVRNKKVINFLLLVFISVNSAIGGGGTITYLGIEKGLSNNSVRCIYQDHNGFMWFGTYDGLNRYDGYNFKVFRNSLNDSTSLPHNYIYTINEDHHNNLWVGTGQGIGIYNNLTLKFLPAYYHPDNSARKVKITFNVNAIKTDENGDVYIGTNGYGLFVQPEGKDAAVRIPLKVGGQQPTGYNVQVISIDQNKRIWLYIRSVGLCLFNKKTRQIDIVNRDIVSAQCIEVDGDNVWIGTTEGLKKFSIKSNSFTNYYTESNGKLTSDNVACLSWDRQHCLWIGTEGGGVNILDPVTDRVGYLLPGEDKNNISSESVYAIWSDRESREWIGTLKGGINIIDPVKKQFQTIAHNPLNKNSLVNNFASSFFEDKDRNLWIGTDGGGLSFWNRKQNIFKNFFHNAANSQSISSNSITSIKQDYLGNTWIATFGGGINKLNSGTGTFEHYSCINDSTKEENEQAWLIFEDRNKTLWATTFNNGKVYRLNRQANRFEVFDQEMNDLIAMHEDREGYLWAGNSHELFRIDRDRKSYKVYEIGKPVRAIYEDKKGNFWIGSEGGGLILFDRKQGKIAKRLSTADGLCNNAVLNILEDNKGCLWLSTFNGLSKFNTTDLTFKSYYQDDGLQSNQFLYNAALKLQSGEFVFGGIKGFNIFYPDSILSHDNMPPVLLTGLRINNTTVTLDNKYVVKTDNDNIQSLKIPFNEAVLAFDFAALEYSAPGKISYAYYLEGWDKGWNYSGNIHSANYTHLREGNYVLRIKATNAEGVWNKQEVAIKITVLPPWFRSWWAYMAYVLIAGAGIYYYQRYKARHTKLQYEVFIAKLNAEKERAELEKERSEREKAQAEYEKEKAEHEMERVINDRDREINEKRLAFFTDVSHEFRTPLTLIINPVKDLINKDQTEADNKELNIVYRNARRLLSLVDQLLLFRKADSQSDVLTIATVNFSELCEDVFLSFVQLAKAKRISYDFECDNRHIVLAVDKEKIEIALFNLLSNALKYTQEGGSVLFKLSENESSIEVAVIDNGPGIQDEVGNKLFDKFYRVPATNSSSKVGFGIGLFLVKQFVESHKGEISYQSEVGRGTVFTMKLVKNRDLLLDNKEAVRKGSLILQELLEEPALQDDGKRLEDLVSGKKSILLVDDDNELRHYVSQVFENELAVTEAESAEEGLKIALRLLPDIIISDITMGGMSGIEFCKTIKNTAETAHIPIILLTGTSSKEIKLQGIECGADDYITKPFEKEILKARVEGILKNRNVLQNYFYNEITLQKNTTKISAEYKEFLDKCIRIVESHLEDGQFSIQALAAELGMSHSTLYKKVKSISGQSVNGFIRFIRLRKAAEILITTEANVNEAALQVGFNDIKYFRSQFNKLFGLNPSQYIKKFRQSFSKNLTLTNQAVNFTNK